MTYNDQWWKSEAERLLRKAFDDCTQSDGGLVWFAGKQYVTFIVPRDLVEEMHRVAFRIKVVEDGEAASGAVGMLEGE